MATRSSTRRSTTARSTSSSDSRTSGSRSSARKRATAKPAKPTRPAIKIEDLADFNESINLLVYGDSGVGKTPFAAMAPRAVILSTEKGSISAKRYGSQAKLIRAFDWRTVEAAIDYLEAHPDEFDWLILDSLTKMQFLLLRHLLGVNVEENRKNADLDLPQIQDHQKWQNMFKRFVDRLVDLDINTIFIATSMHKEDAEGEDLVLPDVHGKDYAIANYVCAQMDGVYCLKVASPKKGDPHWVLLTGRKPPYFAKDRYRALPRLIKYPYMPKVIELIESSIGNGEPLFSPDLMTMPEDAAPDDETSFDEDDIEDIDEEEPEKPAPAQRRRTGTRSTRRPRKAASEPESDEEEDEPEPPKRPTRRSTTRRSKTKEPEPEDLADEEDFDPDELDLEDE